ncbi:hypothetical protein GCM10022380_13030 [Amycolatopsis tucumanensis]|uniref:Uncharacterized protein n=1 Tax=Amycolatopsis tucumanensis TaxID=401106 RepID=A0ABP7HNM2_9PSEU
MNTRTVTRIRRKGGPMMGMDVLILHTADWLLVASGGGDRNPDCEPDGAPGPRGDRAVRPGPGTGETAAARRRRP